tara:strand:- start:1626 stop:1979 length:354 start_codon:yes stop_codon:yes gene_type:complete
MFNDEQIQHWIENYGLATSFTFVIYGDLKQYEVDLIIKGLVLGLDEIEHGKIAIFFDTINEEQAVAWNVYQGSSLSFVFAGDFSAFEEEIKMLVLDGLKYLRYKADYLGTYRSNSYV